MKDNYVISGFNINLKEEEVRGSIKLKDIPSYESGSYLVYEHFTGVAKILEGESQWDITLINNGLALFTLVPMKGRFVPIGLINKYIAMVAIEFYDSTENKLLVRLKEGQIWVCRRG